MNRAIVPLQSQSYSLEFQARSSMYVWLLYCSERQRFSFALHEQGTRNFYYLTDRLCNAMKALLLISALCCCRLLVTAVSSGHTVGYGELKVPVRWRLWLYIRLRPCESRNADAWTQEEWRGEVQHLSWSPRAFLLKGFLSDEECDHLIEMVRRVCSVSRGARYLPLALIWGRNCVYRWPLWAISTALAWKA